MHKRVGDDIACIWSLQQPIINQRPQVLARGEDRFVQGSSHRFGLEGGQGQPAGHGQRLPRARSDLGCAPGQQDGDAFAPPLAKIERFQSAAAQPLQVLARRQPACGHIFAGQAHGQGQIAQQLTNLATLAIVAGAARGPAGQYRFGIVEVQPFDRKARVEDVCLLAR